LSKTSISNYAYSNKLRTQKLLHLTAHFTCELEIILRSSHWLETDIFLPKRNGYFFTNYLSV